MNNLKTIYNIKALICLFFFGQNYEIIAQTAEKIDPSVFQTKKSDKTPFFVVMKNQADISASDNLETKEEKGEFVFSTLRNNADATQRDIQQFLKAKNIDFQSFWIINALFLEGDAALIKLLAARTDVAKIVANPTSRLQLPPIEDFSSDKIQTRSVEKITWGLKKIKADSVWEKNIRGQGAVIGGQDTGYDWAHPSLKKSYRGFLNLKDFKDSANHNYNWHDAIHRDSTSAPNPCGYDSVVPCDDNSHGTHTMGTMAGGLTTNDSTAIGVAPDALWIAARNMNRGFGSLRSYVECFEWFLAPTNLAGKIPNPRLAPHVINNSWYCSKEEGCNPTNFAVMEAAVNACRAAGIVVVVSVGNSGSACSTADGPPGFFTKSFSVGSTAENDTISGFSSRGPVTIDSSFRLKPDISAPGQGVLSSIPSAGYAFFNGTSMAGPHVAGVVALMISANPRLAGQVDVIENIIKQTAQPYTVAQNCGKALGGNVPNHAYGFGRIDALRAVERALLFKPTSLKNNVKNASVRAFPNPFEQNFTLNTEGVEGITNVEVFNISGQLIFTERAFFKANNSFIVTLPPTANGLYFFTIKNKGKIWAGKMMKNQ